MTTEELRAKLDAQALHITRLEAVAKYSSHTPICSTHGLRGIIGGRKCDCGYDTALASLSSESKQTSETV